MTHDVSAEQLIMEKSQSRYNTTTTRYGMVLAENLRLSSSWNYRMKITAVLQKNTYSQIATGEDNYLAVSQNNTVNKKKGMTAIWLYNKNNYCQKADNWKTREHGKSNRSITLHYGDTAASSPWERE